MMLTKYDTTTARILSEAEDIARKTGQQLSSVHYILAIFVVQNDAQTFLLSRKINEDRILAVVSANDREPQDVTAQILRRAEDFAQSFRARDVSPIHLLLAICRTADSIASRLIVSCGARVDQMRNTLFTIASGSMRPGFISGRQPQAVSEQAVAAPRPLRPIEIPREMLPPSVITEDRPYARPQPIPAPAVSRPNLPAQAPEAAGDLEIGGHAASAFELSAIEYPMLTKMGRDITAQARNGGLDTLIGREKELGELVDVLGKRRTNNPILVGEPGVGKTAIVEGLAALIATRPELVPGLAGKAIVELDMGRIMAGTQLRGALAERLNAIKDEVRKADGSVIVFLDEIHQMAGGEGSEDAATGLKSALARGEFPCIGATTTDEYSRFIESDPAFRRRFQMVLVGEPDFAETMKILEGVAGAYQSHHRVTYTAPALKAAVSLSSRYIGDRYLPDKAISILDQAGSMSRREGKSEVTEAEIARVVSRLARIPVEKLLMTDTDRFLRTEEELSRSIVGHSHVIARLGAVIRRNYAGFGARRPIGSFIFLGPTGVGKTETVKALADFLFQSRDAMIRLDMSEYPEPHSIARLVGPPPGYVGFDAGGQLTEAVRRRPFSVVLLDEIEKAHRDVLLSFLQVLDDGRLTDGRGRTVDFSNTVVIMTSNLGNEEFGGTGAPIGFGSSNGSAGADDAESRVLEAARRALPVELWNRIDEKLVFRPLDREQIRRIAGLLLDESCRRLAAERGIRFEADQKAIEALIDGGGFVPELGARPMRQAIQRLVEAGIAEMVLRGEARSGDTIHVSAGDGGIVFSRE